MDAQIHSNLRVFELKIGGAFVIPADGTKDTKEDTSPLGLTTWASSVDTNKW